MIKDEYLETYDINNINEAKTLLKDIVNLYNSERPHMSISNLTPNHIHHSKTKIKIERLWKNYYRKNPTIVNPNQD
ncbi:MAG: integrase core domain-containing protein [Chitinophagales bacterium]|nr:integrase core domain-containing protein [Chitinophagales bacterium]